MNGLLNNFFIITECIVMDTVCMKILNSKGYLEICLKLITKFVYNKISEWAKIKKKLIKKEQRESDIRLGQWESR